MSHNVVVPVEEESGGVFVPASVRLRVSDHRRVEVELVRGEGGASLGNSLKNIFPHLTNFKKFENMSKVYYVDVVCGDEDPPLDARAHPHLLLLEPLLNQVEVFGDLKYSFLYSSL